MALDLAAHTDRRLVFGSQGRGGARSLPFSTAKLLVEVVVEGWDIREPLTLACHGDRGVKASVQRAVLGRCCASGWPSSDAVWRAV